MKKQPDRDTFYARIALWMKLGALAVVLGLVGVMMVQVESTGQVGAMPPHASAPLATAQQYSLASLVDIDLQSMHHQATPRTSGARRGT